MNPARFERAKALIDAANAEDPHQVVLDGKSVAKELAYSLRMSDMLDRFAPDAPDAMKLAARAQHIRRWAIPRNAYPMTTAGYKQWRTTLYGFHADLAGELLGQAGYDEVTVARVKTAIAKKQMASNADTRLLEDVAALVFLEHYMADFAAGHPDYDEAKWLGILRKTWLKMTEAARSFALSGAVRLPQPLMPLIEKAVSSP